MAALPRIRGLAPRAHVCVYGLYAPMNETLLHALGVGTVLGGELERAAKCSPPSGAWHTRPQGVPRDTSPGPWDLRSPICRNPGTAAPNRPSISSSPSDTGCGRLRV